jgi:hypothetical protein
VELNSRTVARDGVTLTQSVLRLAGNVKLRGELYVDDVVEVIVRTKEGEILAQVNADVMQAGVRRHKPVRGRPWAERAQSARFRK